MAQDVLCEVSNCVHYREGNKCAATEIYIVSHQGVEAMNTRETDCHTFEMNDIT